MEWANLNTKEDDVIQCKNCLHYKVAGIRADNDYSNAYWYNVNPSDLNLGCGNVYTEQELQAFDDNYCPDIRIYFCLHCRNVWNDDM